jgi:hypothetical protein
VVQVRRIAGWIEESYPKIDIARGGLGMVAPDGSVRFSD